jgi:hypothetical protein
MGRIDTAQVNNWLTEHGVALSAKADIDTTNHFRGAWEQDIDVAAPITDNPYLIPGLDEGSDCPDGLTPPALPGQGAYTQGRNQPGESGLWSGRSGASEPTNPEGHAEWDSPLAFSVGLPQPNPTSGVVDFQLVVPTHEGILAAVYDVSGRRLAVINAGPVAPGRRVLRWNGLDSTGERAASGIYFLSVRAGSQREIRRFVLLR